MQLRTALIFAISAVEGAAAFSLVSQPGLLRSSGINARLGAPLLCPATNRPAAAGMHSRVGLRRSRGCLTMQAQEIGIMEGSGPVRKAANLGLWAAFLAFATFLAPDVDPDATAAFFKDTLAFFQGQDSPANPILVAIWTAFPLWPASLCGLICPLKPKNQALPELPFVAASFVIGTGAMAPYLALNSYAEGETDSESALAKTFGGKPAAAAMLIGAIAALAFAVGVFAPNDINGGSDYPIDVIFFSYLRDLGTLLQTQKVASVPTLDSAILWVLSAVPLLEDMKRRKWFSGDAADWALYASFMAAPLIGTCVWLCVRPELPAATVAAASSEE